MAQRSVIRRAALGGALYHNFGDGADIGRKLAADAFEDGFLDPDCIRGRRGFDNGLLGQTRCQAGVARQGRWGRNPLSLRLLNRAAMPGSAPGHRTSSAHGLTQPRFCKPVPGGQREAAPLLASLHPEPRRESQEYPAGEPRRSRAEQSRFHHQDVCGPMRPSTPANPAPRSPATHCIRGWNRQSLF